MISRLNSEICILTHFYFQTFQSDTYEYDIKFSKKIDYSLITVSSKAASNSTLPYRTSCWGSSDTVDPSNQKLYVSAQVEQGNRPVLNAKVE